MLFYLSAHIRGKLSLIIKSMMALDQWSTTNLRSFVNSLSFIKSSKINKFDKAA
uniref:Uncharacterized protein n=1 Tax=Lepeophtheirus salmonis TaxID=72036 RepID=A0A0K2TXQ8_LEPSM